MCLKIMMQPCWLVNLHESCRGSLYTLSEAVLTRDLYVCMLMVFDGVFSGCLLQHAKPALSPCMLGFALEAVSACRPGCKPLLWHCLSREAADMLVSRLLSWYANPCQVR